MALFQPTNIIPSSFTVGVVDAVDTASVSWQVNGNSAMTAFKIDFYTYSSQSLDASDSWFRTTGKQPISGGFYGTDRFGKPKIFTWTAEGNMTWHAFHYAFINGKQYKLKITQYWEDGGVEKSIEQIEEIVFITRRTPQVEIYQTDNGFVPKDADVLLIDGVELATSIGYFRANYTQEEGDAVRSVRWQIATATFPNNRWRVGEIISDTGEINTPTLEFVFNGLFNKGEYAVRCLIESESGQRAQNQNSNDNGWVFFTINIANQGSYDGKFTLQCLPRENAALLELTQDNEISIVPATSGKYTRENGALELDPYAEIKWSGTKAFNAPWTVAIEFYLQTTEQFIMKNPDPYGSKTYSQTFQLKGRVRRTSDIKVEAGFIETYEVSIAEDGKSCTVTIRNAQSNSRPKVTVHETPFAPYGTLANIETDSGNISIEAVYLQEEAITYYGYAIDINGERTVFNLPTTSDRIAVIITDKKVLFYDGGAKYKTNQLTYEQGKIKSISIRGGVVGATFRNVSVFKSVLDDELIESLYSDPDFKPSWDSDQYELYLNANFVNNIYGGKTFAYRVYRQEIGKDKLYPIFYSKIGDIYQLKDYGIVSRKSYTYWLYEYDKNDAYLVGARCTLPGSDQAATISTCFNSYSLLVCDYDDVNDLYHVRKQYLFALNLSASSEGNNNSPTLNKNFTPYPTRMPDSANYLSGTLQGLIGVIYTVPALVEQIGEFKRTVKASTLDYFDNVDLEKEIRDLSVTMYTLFLRDTKGHLRMVATNNQVSMTPDLKKRQIPLTMSFPWVEIGDASDVSIIQTPDDEGWGDSGAELDVQPNMESANGILAANYPKPYSGIKFYLTGANDKARRG